MKLLTTNPDSTDVASVEFTSSIDSTYKLYIFKFIDINPATDSQDFRVNFSTDGGSNYNMTKTTTAFLAYNYESDAARGLTYMTGNDIAQGTGGQILAGGVGNGADESAAGTLWLFNPSNTTYVKHFYAVVSNYYTGNYIFNSFIGGYVNITGAIDEVDFKMSSGAMDAVIKMYGVG